ncbi:MAG: cytochrome c3 family protein [Desulfitobacterium sp.]
MSKRKGSSSKLKLLILLGSLIFVLVAVIGCGTQQEAKAPAANQPAQPSQPAVAQISQMPNNHAKMGLGCNSCHGDTVGGPVAQDKCLNCHKSMAEVATKTVDMTPNPHGPHHYDTADCTTCHAVHDKSTMMCSTCHAFPWIEELDPEVWEKL